MTRCLFLVLGLIAQIISAEKYCGIELANVTLENYGEFDGAFLAYADDPYRTCFKIKVEVSADKSILRMEVSNQSNTAKYTATQARPGVFYFDPLDGNPVNVEHTIFYKKGALCETICNADNMTIKRLRCFAKTKKDSCNIKQFLKKNANGKGNFYKVYDGCD